MCVEHTYDARTRSGEFGAVAFETLEDHGTDWLNAGRTIHAGYYDDGWEFGANGPPLPFEESERYNERRIRDRFTDEMLERYCAQLGIDLFNENFYGPEFELFTRSEQRASLWGKAAAQLRMLMSWNRRRG